MISRRALTVGAIIWAIVGSIVGLTALPDVNPDAVVLFAVLCAVGPSAAVLASFALRNFSDRLAGLSLVTSVVTPAVFAWPLNLAALVAGLALLISPSKVIRDRRVDRV